MDRSGAVGPGRYDVGLSGYELGGFGGFFRLLQSAPAHPGGRSGPEYYKEDGVCRALWAPAAIDQRPRGELFAMRRVVASDLKRIVIRPDV